MCYGRLSVHSLARNETRAVRSASNLPAVLVMAQVRA
jgi:hypothetical protein